MSHTPVEDETVPDADGHVAFRKNGVRIKGEPEDDPIPLTPGVLKYLYKGRYEGP